MTLTCKCNVGGGDIGRAGRGSILVLLEGAGGHSIRLSLRLGGCGVRSIVSLVLWRVGGGPLRKSLFCFGGMLAFNFTKLMMRSVNHFVYNGCKLSLEHISWTFRMAKKRDTIRYSPWSGSVVARTKIHGFSRLRCLHITPRTANPAHARTIRSL